MRVGVLTQWYDPEPGPAALPGVLARGLRDRGHEVQVVTGYPNYPSGRLPDSYRMRWRADEEVDGVRVRRVALYPSHDRSTARRVLNYSSLAASALVSGTPALRDLDALWVNGSPATIGVPMWAAKHGHRVPVVLHLLDLWPDTVWSSGFVERLGPQRRDAQRRSGVDVVESGLHAWCRRMYRSADVVAYISPGVGPRLLQRGVPAGKLAYAPLWADERLLRPRPAPPRAQLEAGLSVRLGLTEEHVVLVYAGTLGGTQGLEALLEACGRVEDRRFACLVAGSGVAEGELRARAEQRRLSNVRFLGRLPKERIPDLLATADVHYVGLRPDASSAVTMPSKLQAALACGRALLVAVDGDAAAVARDSGAGLAVAPGDPDAIAAGIRALCALGRDGLAERGARGRGYYERTFAEDVGIDRVERLLSGAAAGWGSSGRRAA